MNTKLLKQKILDLAIRGKLTQQLKSDGTAADLLTQISDERRKTRDERKGTRSKKSGVLDLSADRIQEKTSLRAKRGNPSPQTIIPLDKNEAPFEIPANWEWVRLGDVCELLNGDRSSNYPNKNEYVVCGVAWINTGHIRPDGFLDEKTMNYITEEKYNSLGNGKIHKFDLVYCLRGATFGKVARVEPFEKGAIASSLMIIRPILSQMRDFLYRCLKTDFAMNQLRKFDNGSAQPNLAAKDVSRYFVPLPPLAEQQRIVAKIEEAFAEIDAIEKNKELLKTHIKQTRQKILDLAIHGKLVPQNKSDEPASVLLERITRDNPHYEKLTDIPFEIPESWEWVNAEDLFNIRSAIRIHQTDWQKEGIPFFRGRELVQLCKTGNVDFEIYISEKLYEENKRKGGVPQKNDILVSAVGTLGFAYVVKGNKPFYYKDAYILCFENRHNLNPFYFQHLIHSKFINKIIYGGSKGTTVDQLTIENAKKLPMPLPPLAEQKRIVNKIEEIFASLDAISRHLD